ncbi:TIGR01244 family sulfur transferase [Yunchengibacter salinarum]|uniref:TIGR01244 family sulfur transferase n=1 Tax=Yunchengibacter salinarum TaxID=3133399 RepID=UPI0035B5E372
MTAFLTLTETFRVAPQIEETDLDRAASEGVRLVISNRPDGEAADQPANAALKDAARAHGLDWLDIPIQPGQVTMEAVSRTAEALQQAGGPVLAFCRTGTRSATLWALAEAAHGSRPLEDIISRAAEAGYDLAPMEATLSDLRADQQNDPA